MTVINIVGEGDSLTFTSTRYFFRHFNKMTESAAYGDGLGIRYGYRFFPAADQIVANYALAGTTLSLMAARAPTLDALINLNPGAPGVRGQVYANERPDRKYILCFMAGTNVNDPDPAVLAASISSYCLARKAAGWDRVILGTLISRNDGNIANFDTAYAQPYNAIVKGVGWAAANGVDAICDFAGDARLGATGASLNPLYFELDAVHPNATGEQIMADIFAPVLASVIASL